jgi:hypothetical protein
MLHDIKSNATKKSGGITAALTHDGRAAAINRLAALDFQLLNQSSQTACSPSPATADCFDGSTFDIHAQAVKNMIGG